MSHPTSHPRAVLMLLLIAIVGVIAFWTSSGDAPVASVAPTDATQTESLSGATTSVTTLASVARATTDLAAVPPQAEGTLDDSCLTGVAHEPTGELAVVAGVTDPSPDLDAITYMVEVEEGLGVDADCFAALVEDVLGDARSWGAIAGVAVARVDEGEVDFRVTLASPETTDERCLPLNTAGIYSCFDSERAMINVWRWELGTADYADNLAEYRVYVINHEVGHGLGYDHVECSGAGARAPVMQQQTKGLDGCVQNGWPLGWES